MSLDLALWVLWGLLMQLYVEWKSLVPYRLGFSPQPQKNILVSHSRINPAPWKYLIYTNPAQGFLPDRLQNTPKIPVFQSRTPKINRYFSCAQSPRRAKNDILARWYKSVWYWKNDFWQASCDAVAFQDIPMRCQLACMPVRFGRRNFWSMTMVSATLCRSHTWRC